MSRHWPGWLTALICRWRGHDWEDDSQQQSGIPLWKCRRCGRWDW